MKEKIAVIGLGYVGLPLAHVFSEKCAPVCLDIDHPTHILSLPNL